MENGDDDFSGVDWEWWRSQSPDVIGWITVPGTNIDLSVCQALVSDPTYYLTHDAYGKWNIYGYPYLDAECVERSFDSPLAMAFVHHMSDGSMFAEMVGYSGQGFFDDRREILLQTPDQKMWPSVVAAGIADSYAEFKRLDFEDAEDLKAWWSETWANADARRSCEAESESIEAFVTCSYGLWNGHERAIVYAVEEVV